MKVISISSGLWLLLSSSADGFVPFSKTFVKLSTSETSLGYASTSFPDGTDPYVILNLQPGVDLKEIKKAYRKMALKYHPDAIRGSEKSEEEMQEANDTFAKINAAYAFLTGKSEDKPPDENGHAHPPNQSSRQNKQDHFHDFHFHRQEPHTYQPASKANRRRATSSSNFHQEESYFSHSGDHTKRNEYTSQGRPSHPSATTHGYDSNGDSVRRHRKKPSVSFGMNLNWGGSVSENVSPPPIDNSAKKTFVQGPSSTQDKSTLFNRGDTVHIVHGEHNGKCGPVTSICANILKIEVNSTMSIFVEERHVLSEQAYRNKILADEADYPRPQPSSPTPTESTVDESMTTYENPTFNSTFVEQLKIKYNISDSQIDEKFHDSGNNRINRHRGKRKTEIPHAVKPQTFRKKQEEENKEEDEYSDFVNDDGVNILEVKNMNGRNIQDHHTSEGCNRSTISFTEGDFVKIMEGSLAGDIGIVMSVYPNILKLDVLSNSVFMEKECLRKLNPKELFTRSQASDAIASQTQCPNFPGDLSDKVLLNLFEPYHTQHSNKVEESEIDGSEMKCFDLEDCILIEGCDMQTDESPNVSVLPDHMVPIYHQEILSECYTLNGNKSMSVDTIPQNTKRISRLRSILHPKQFAKLAIGLFVTLLLKRI